MITSVPEWVAYLEQTDTILGVPLILAGLGLMIFGWRLWRPCVMVSFGLIGYALGAHFLADNPHQLWLSVGLALGLAAVSYWPAKYSLAILGGLVGAALLAALLVSNGLTGSILWILTGTALFACAGMALINRQLVVIALTAFEGSILLVSGLAALVMTVPALYGAFAAHGRFTVGFGLLVPTVMSCFYQVAEIHKGNKRL